LRLSNVFALEVLIVAMRPPLGAPGLT